MDVFSSTGIAEAKVSEENCTVAISRLETQPMDRQCNVRKGRFTMDASSRRRTNEPDSRLGSTIN